MNERYSRQTILPEIAEEGQRKLTQSHIAIVGCGGLGAIAAVYLGGAGIGQLTIIDGDIPDISNLHRQVFYSSDDSRSKVTILKERMKSLNPEVRVHSIENKLAKNNIDELLTGVDLVLECSDDQMCKYLVNDFCALEGIPLVYGAIHKYEGYLSLFSNRNETDIHLRDIFPIPDLNVPVCAELGVLSTIAGMIGILQANEALKFILDIGDSLQGKLLTYDILTSRQMILNLKKNWKKDLEELFDQCDYSTPSSEHVIEIELMDLLKERSDIQLISIMNKSENQLIDHQTIHVEQNEIAILDLDKLKKNVLYCRSGEVSKIVVDRLLSNDPGFLIYSLKGGFKAFQKYKNSLT